MPARSPRQAPLAGRIAAIERHHGPDDPRLAGLRARLAGCRMSEDLADWAARAAAELPPLVADEVAEVAQIAATIDQRLAAQPGQEAGAA